MPKDEKVVENVEPTGFDDVFDNLTRELDDNPEDEVPPNDPETAEDDTAEEDIVEEDAADEEDDDDEPADEEDDDSEDEEDSEPVATDDDDDDEEDEEAVLSQFMDMVKRGAAAEKSKEAQPAAAPEQSTAEPELYTPEEQAVLSAYEKDWPDVAKAESLRRRAEYRELVQFVFNQVAENVRPIYSAVQNLSERTHYSDLTSEVEDYDTVRENVVAWVDDQPAYLQAAYKNVIERGTVAEVKDLVDRYKKETGTMQTQKTAPSGRKKQETELPTSTKKAAAALAPVSSKRSVIPQQDDPDDFEGAFERFAAKIGT